MLATYITETQQLLNDSQGQMFSLPTITSYVNRARRRIAYASGCIRIIPPGAQTLPMQERYPFAHWIALCQEVMPGIQSILACRSIAIGMGGRWEHIHAQHEFEEREFEHHRHHEHRHPYGPGWQIVGGAWKAMWRNLPWTDFQARFRIYGGTFVGTISEPGWWSQYGSGELGEIFLAPIPTQHCPIEADLTCIPQPLLTDSDPEPIPLPWQDAVCWWAAVLCLLQQQRREDAQAMAQLFLTELPFARAVVTPQMIQNPYAPGIMRSA